MRKHELVLVEAGGIFKRSPTDPPFTAVPNNTFGAAPGEKFTFVNVVTYPKLGAFKTPKERDQALSKVLGKEKAVPSNVPLKNMLAFAIATFEGERGQTVKFIRYFLKINPSMFARWKNNELPGLQSELQGSRKRRAGLMSKDILGGKLEFSNGRDLMSYVQNLDTLSLEIKAGLKMIEQGQFPVFKNSERDFAAIRDNLGEIIQALCITYGLVGGDADLARVNIFTDYNVRWDQLAIRFPSSAVEGLVDFYLESGDTKLAVSAKGGRGASGSITNFNSALKFLSPTESRNFKKKYPDAAKLLEFNDTYSGKELPLYLAMEKEYNTENIKSSNVERILKLISTNERDIKKLTAWERAQIKAYNATASGPSWNYGFWILAKIAKDIVQQFNDNPKNSQAFKYLLNKSAMMQCYTKAVSNANGDVVITAVNTYFPMTFTGTVQLTSDTRYKATSAEGTFTFRLRQ